ncbi:MAG: signal peptide peptidase SppA [Microcoleus sp. PH2017_29_MFU_D_A]|jgi:protease IV|uniref:signal peptide peptidase SppA n=1 Tax=unclassified Microcoleus TaxID=2642155 RepID=UPI001D852D3D|nr:MULTISPECIES: signal peptide peptidase SppA [unclassified Microcoleus]MCC3457709.1 signal peptide peptidase SppA [Microcoleus sp. PH2017_08_TRC_O_A]MCC3491679.1 signal peptide peptidase SppA [Microcoleus sp. PH2017_16_JOR_D_A]MCC3498368.1 signal peptide peptidase SppA [Microcoleus sp. PH2017_15_JOR_U_A]MCC3575921.1 signal peptide peptidase SppA [Microcoleus sp. PH2017_34_RAT_O_A]MCC3585848.1 signal peptide peptidase SppA [Microcoleus sp. PH2017_30_WIL_O_A]
MKDFLKYTCASLLGTFLGLLLLGGIGLGGLVLLIALAASSSKDSGPQVKDKSVLVLDLSLNITDSKPSRSTSAAIQEALSDESGDAVTLRTVLDAIESAKKDPKIVGMYLEGSSDSSSSGFANLKEVRSALQRFRDAKKPIFAYEMDWNERDYYLGSVANTIAINPYGSLELNGFSSQAMFWTGALEKYGVGVQVTRVGKYKSAVEPFLLKKMSPENRQQTQKLLGDIWGEYLKTVGPSRKLSVPQLQAVADNGGTLMANEALKGKLVDKVVYFDEIATELKKLTGTDAEDKSFKQISLKNYARVAESKNSTRAHKKNQIAVLYAEGEIVDGEGGPTQVGGDRIAEEMRKIREDDDIKAVVLRVNSPGGSATAAEVIGREVALTGKKKPVIVSMGNLAASGGYWISMGSSKIFAEASTITGSIGVFGMLFNAEKLAANNGITWDVVKTARFADTNTVSRPKNPQELANIQRIVDRIYDLFITKVADSRKLPKNKVQEIAQGRVWSGTAAKQLGLVDEIGGLEDAVREAAKQAKLGDDWQLEEYPKRRSLEEQILERISGVRVLKPATKLDPLSAEVKKMQDELAVIKSMNDPQGIYVRLPFDLRIN